MRILTFLKAVAQQLGLFEETVEVKGHARKDGSYVKPHQAKRKKKAKKQSERDLFDAAFLNLSPDQNSIKKEK